MTHVIDLVEEDSDGSVEEVPKPGLSPCSFGAVTEGCEDYPTVVLDETDDDQDEPQSTLQRQKGKTRRTRWVTPKEKIFKFGTAKEVEHPGRKRCKVEDDRGFEVFVLEGLDRSSRLSKQSISRGATPGKEVHLCATCGFESSQSKIMKMHLRTHTGEKPYKCNFCDFRSAQSANLVTHERTHSHEKPYTCKLCSHSFSQLSNLKRHMLIHTGEKPYECSICGYKCVQRNDIIRHGKIHTGEKTLACDNCDYTCIQSATLKRHVRNRHGKLFACNSCDFRCGLRIQMKAHQKCH